MQAPGHRRASALGLVAPPPAAPPRPVFHPQLWPPKQVCLDPESQRGCWSLGPLAPRSPESDPGPPGLTSPHSLFSGTSGRKPSFHIFCLVF